MSKRRCFSMASLGTLPVALARWAGELGLGDYLSTGYFTSGAQDADRWQYYRKMTEGQETIM